MGKNEKRKEKKKKFEGDFIRGEDFWSSSLIAIIWKTNLTILSFIKKYREIGWKLIKIPLV